MIKLIDLLPETIKKVDDKWVVYPKKGGKRLGTHDTKEKALKQLAAIEINKENVNEVGESSAKPYKWTTSYKDVDDLPYEFNYQFKVPELPDIKHYEVAIFIDQVQDDMRPRHIKQLQLNPKDWMLSLSFWHKGHDGDIPDDSEINNIRVMFRIMSTVTSMVSELVKKYPQISILRYDAITKYDEKASSKSITQRDKLYRAFIKKAMPGAEFLKADRETTYVKL
jgi:hypothetical protein